MQLIKNGQIVEDAWQHVDAESALPQGDVIVPLARWLAEKDSLRQHDGQVGVSLQGGDNTRDLKDDVEALPLIAINFPKFADGRGYSHARILREQLGYKGELRAFGDILRDQIFYLHRCGFNAFEGRDGESLDNILEGLKDFTVTYQAAADNPLPIYRQ